MFTQTYINYKNWSCEWGKPHMKHINKSTIKFNHLIVITCKNEIIMNKSFKTILAQNIATDDFR